MRKKYFALGLGERGTTLIMEAIGAARPRGFVPETPLSDLDRKGEELASQWIGEIALRYLMAHHAATFAPYLALTPPATRAVPVVSADAIVPLRLTLEGVMHPHLEIGVADNGDALTMRRINESGGQEGEAQDITLLRFNSLGFDYLTGHVGGIVLLVLARDHPAAFAPYSHLVVPTLPVMKPDFFMFGINEAGTTLVIKPVGPKRRNPFCPEFFLSEWDRKGFDEASGILGEMLLRLLKAHHAKAFSALSLTPPAGEPEPKNENVTAINPFDWNGAMRDARLAVGMNYGYETLQIAPFVGDKPVNLGESVELERLDNLGPHQAWRVVGELVLRKLATMHPDAFAPFVNLSH